MKLLFMISQTYPLYCKIYSMYCEFTLCIATSTHYIVQSPSSAAAQVVVLAGTVPSGRRVEWEKCPVKTVVGVKSHMTCMCVTIVMCQNCGT